MRSSTELTQQECVGMPDAAEGLPGAPTRIDRNRDAVNGVGVGAREVDRSARQLVRLEEIAPRRRQGAHLLQVFAHVRSSKMRVQRCCDIAGREGIDIDIVTSDLDRQRARQIFEATLGRAIGWTIGARADAPDRGDVDDLASAAAPELGKGGANEEEGALEIEVELCARSPRWSAPPTRCA